MDIKAKIEELVGKITSDASLGEKFKSDPTGTIKGLIGVDLPDDQLKSIADGVKAKVGIDNITSAIGGIFGKKD